MKKLFALLESKSLPGMLLLLATVAALVFANTPLSGFYDVFKSLPVVFQAGGFIIDKPLLLWINDGLMAIFFLLVGLEIKREIVEGHLSSREKMALPFLAAIGGLVFPALIYVYLNWGDPVSLQGWAIPAATDIAFALGVLTVLGPRVPVALKIALVAIAIIDDLAAIVIIALFYTAEISTHALVGATLALLMVATLNRSKVVKVGPYVFLGLVAWAFVLKSGVHATLAGVALGLLIPIKDKNAEGRSPLITLEKAIYPWVGIVIIPLFAFVNAGVSFEGVTLETLTNPITLGIALGLFFGKQIGVMLFTWVGCALKICQMPEGVSWPQYYGLAVLTGIGFTMSLFIGTLAFQEVDYATPVRLGVLLASACSALLGAGVLLATTKK